MLIIDKTYHTKEVKDYWKWLDEQKEYIKKPRTVSKYNVSKYNVDKRRALMKDVDELTDLIEEQEFTLAKLTEVVNSINTIVPKDEVHINIYPSGGCDDNYLDVEIDYNRLENELEVNERLQRDYESYVERYDRYHKQLKEELKVLKELGLNE